MSDKTFSPKKSSDEKWRRPSDKVNVLKASSKSNDFSTADMNVLLKTVGMANDFKLEIETIIDIRILNGSEQYLVRWKSTKSDSWESEKHLEVHCKEALVKYWIHCLFSRDKNIDGTPPKQFFQKKLGNWASQPIPTSGPSPKKKSVEGLECRVVYLTPSKKRPRRANSDDEDTEPFVGGRLTRGSEKKPRVFSQQSYPGNELLSPVKCEFPVSPKLEKLEGEILNRYPTDSRRNVFGMDEINDLADSPACEHGEVIVNKSLSESLKDSYLVKWSYVSYETSETLGIVDEDLQKHFMLELPSANNKKFQLERRKYGKATIREVPSFIKSEASKKSSSSSTADSDSDFSEASTHPPSEILTEPKEAYYEESEDLEDKKMEVACQTGTELDPYTCTYCQSKRGERTSQRRRNKSAAKEDGDSSAKITETKVVLKPEDANADEDDDEDLVDIEYEVEHIVDYKIIEGTKTDEYFVKWKGFTAQYNTWEPYSNLSNCNKVLITFYVNRMADRRQIEQDHSKNENAKESGSAVTTTKKPPVLPPLPPVPEPVLEVLAKVAPITDGEVEMAFKNSLTATKKSRWTKNKLRKCLLDLIGEPSSNAAGGQVVAAVIAQSELPILRHQILMLEGERRKELIMKDLKQWETHLNWIAQGRPEIIVENKYDLAGPPVDFKYVNDNVIGEDVNFPDDTVEGCNCEDACSNGKDKDKNQCCPGKHGKVLAYNCFRRLRVPPGYPIYECNKRCKCGPECTNRVVQDGTVSLIGTKLCIFRTSNGRGWGVKTLKKIKRGTFVCLYAGEIITTEEAESRGRVYENQLGASYLFDLDYYSGSGGNDDDESCPYTIDATKMGNVSHFINHSCDPNLCVFNVWADCVDQNLPKLAFFALREINKDEELTYDYGSQDDDQPTTTAAAPSAPSLFPSEPDSEDDMESEIDPAMLAASSPAKNRMKLATMSAVRRPCLCGSANCRKVLF